MPGGAAPGDPVVLVPAGAPMLDAAGWVGHACWSELRLHQVLTDWLTAEPDPELSTTLWRVRSHRAAIAEAWHRRLPELRELPRAGFVEPGATDEEGVAVLDELSPSATTTERAAALAGALATLVARYDAHVAVAVGPADGPTVATLGDAIRATTADVASLEAWTVEA